MSYIGNPLASMNYPVDYFTGTGTTSTFTLSQIPASATSLLVYIGGVKQIAHTFNPAYLVNGNQLIFASPPAANSPIEVIYLGILSQVNVPASQSITPSMLSLQVANAFLYQTTTNGSQNIFTLQAPPVSANSLIVTANGVVQYDYTVNSANVTLGFTPPAGTLLRIQSLALAQAGVPNDGSVTTNKLAANAVTIPNISATGTANSSTYLRGDGTWSIINQNSVAGNLTISGVTQSNNGLYSSNNFTGTYTDGIVVDYVNGNGRLSVGSGDGLTIYNNGVASVPLINFASNSNIYINSNGAITLPVGNTSQRPANAAIGMVRYNTDTAVLENYTSQGWLKVSVPIPIIASISGTIYAGNTSTITINGSNFEPTTGTVSFQISGNSAIQVSATPNAGGTQVSCLVPAGIYLSPVGSLVNITYTNSDGGVSGIYSMTTVGLPTGGTITQTGNTRIHSFSSSGTLTVPTSFSVSANFLLVAGGGGAGFDVGGGGGAGGVISGTASISTGSYPISIGSGGGSGQSSAVKGSSGGNSTFSSYTAIGGGGGGSYPGNGAGLSGGSGGGGGDSNSSGGSGTSGQGYSGGSSAPSSWGSGAGGGAGGAGPNGIANSTVAGGLYITSSISGTSANYAGGGYGNLDSGTVQATGVSYPGTGLGSYGFGANGTGAPNASPYSGNGGVFLISYSIT